MAETEPRRVEEGPSFCPPRKHIYNERVYAHNPARLHVKGPHTPAPHPPLPLHPSFPPSPCIALKTVTVGQSSGSSGMIEEASIDPATDVPYLEGDIKGKVQ